MLSPKPAWAYGEDRDRKAKAMDFTIALAVVVYIYYEWRFGTYGGAMYAGGIVVGILIVRGRDWLMRKKGWGGGEDDE